jgi:hypothetical protein
MSANSGHSVHDAHDADVTNAAIEAAAEFFDEPYNVPESQTENCLSATPTRRGTGADETNPDGMARLASQRAEIRKEVSQHALHPHLAPARLRLNRYLFSGRRLQSQTEECQPTASSRDSVRVGFVVSGVES